MIERAAFIALVNLLFYYKTFSYKYVSDDILSAQRPGEKERWKHILWTIEGYLKAGNPRTDHVLTTLIHTLVCIGIYLGFGANDVSLLGALLFAVNPINNQVAVWISGRGYALSALGMVWALSLPWWLGLLPLLVACYSNAGFFMPVVLLGSSHWIALAFIPIVWGLYFNMFRKNVKQKMNMEMFEEDKKIEPFKLILATKTFGFYLSHALVPIKTTFYHSFLESLAGSKKMRARTLCRFFWIGLAAIVAMGFYIMTHRWDMVCFGILWWCVGIAPFLNFMRLQQEIAERYVYVANVGLSVILASVLVNYPVAAGFVLAMYATKMWFGMEAYKDDFWLIEHAVLNSPDSWFAWNARAHQRWVAQSHQEAIIFWVIALRLSPNEFKLLINIASALALMGPSKHKEALEYIAQAEKNIPGGQEKQCADIIANFKQGKVCFLL